MRGDTLGNWFRVWKTLRWPLRVGIPLALLLLSVASAWAIVTNLTRVEELHDGAAVDLHVDQAELLALVQAGQNEAAFEQAFEEGDELFDVQFNALDGVGANVGNGQRFTRVPRADLRGAGQWFRHTPARPTGPNAANCTACHQPPFDGAGETSANVIRDPQRGGQLGKFIQRNTPHLFAPGAVQVLAEEMTEELHAIREAARVAACQSGANMRTLTAKGVAFGTIVANRTVVNPCTVTYDTANVRGVSADLIIRPFQWKGSDLNIRIFSRVAFNNELGMQPVEITGDNVDGDFDSVRNEITIGDMTAMSVYLAAQPRPTSLQELASLGLIPALPAAQNNAINAGRTVFTQIGCASCHVAQFTINDPVFFEPSQNANYRDATFPAGQNPVQRGVTPQFPVRFNLTTDQPDNRVAIPNSNGSLLGSLRRDAQGRGIIELFGDLKRHNMGTGLAEAVDEVGTGASTFLTENLWGVGSTAPYMHDGRDTTLTEAILEHSGEAQDAFNAFNNTSATNRANLIAFLSNLVLFEVPAP
ncbi:MAG TPA: di-heme oxidoredictase family protein [Anaerolineae bacterium]|nr:di-heme oxidoredictase family protein [Anaerolineae bacterium]